MGPRPSTGTADQSGVLLGVMGSMLVEVSQTIGEAKPGPSSVVYAPPAYESHTTREVGGRSVPTGQRIVIKVVLDHDTVRLTRQMSETYVIPRKGGQAEATVTDAATVSVSMAVCPDPTGVVRGLVTTQSTTDFAAVDGPSYHSEFNGADQLRAQVGDQAQVIAAGQALSARRRATGRRPAFGSQPAVDTDATLGVTATHAIEPARSSTARL